MLQYVIELSGYALVTLFVLYTFLSFWSFGFKQEDNYKAIYVAQNLLTFTISLLCFFNLAYINRDKKYVILYIFVQIFLLFCVVMINFIYKKINKLLLNNMCVLINLGFCMISRISIQKAERQYIIAVVSLAVCLAIPFIISKSGFFRNLTWVYALVGIVMLSSVWIFGDMTNGSKISFNLSGITFQPSEFVKIIYLFFLAACLWKNASLKRIIMTSVLAGIHVILLVLSTDLGSALIFFVCYVFVVYLASGKIRYLLAGLSGGCVAALVAYQIFDHVKVRVLAFSDPWTYIDKQGYQITQSLFAIGSGKWLGTGLLKGNPKAIPFVDADFVFSSICEELGSIIGICIILICLCSFFMIMAIASKMKDNFYRLVSFGIGIMYIFQIFLTIGGGIKFIPLTGVTLPLISYGGSSVMTTMIMYFIVQGIYIKECSMEKMEEIELAPEESFRNAKRKKDKKEQEEQATQNNLVENLSNIVLKQKKSPVIVSGFMFTVLFASMVGYLCNFVKNDQEEMLNNTYNSRQQLLAVRNYRGTIFSADGEALAETVLDSNNKEWRYYPYKNLFAHVVGFSTNGKMGVEAMANYYLINTHESIPNRVANSMAGRKNLGDNVYTTLDVNLQKIADDQLSLYKGSVIVTEVKTGKILAMVSHPDFNPNEIEKIWDGLIEDENSTVLVNRTTQGLYPPGSTFKILTALEYIRENPEDYLNYQYDCSGTYTNGNNKISCYHKSVHHTVDFMKSFAKSCNSSFANIGMSLDRENFKSTLEGLYFGKELPISLKCALSQYNLPLSGGDSEVMQTAIGQGKTLITPMQMHLITSAIANDGVLIKPYLLEKVESAEGELIKKFETEKIQTTITKEEANILKKLMAMVVTEGTASKLTNLDFSAAGKTGSAEYSNVKGESHAWFTGFAPADNPEICVTIIVEGAGSGGDYAVPIAKQIFQEYFNR